MQQTNETTTEYRNWLRATHGPAHARRTAERNAAFLLPHLRPGMRLLDAGCGAGSITIGLAAAVAPGETTGIDVSAESVDAARALAEERGSRNVRFEAGDVYALPFDDASFDAAFIHAVLQHLSDPLAALREIRRVLRPGAVIGVSDMDFGGVVMHPMTPALQRALDLMRDLRLRDGGTVDAGRRLRSLLHDAGFERVSCAAVPVSEGTSEAASRTAAWRASYLEAPAFIGHVVETGLATDSELHEMAAAWRAWGADPGAFFAGWGCEALGWVE